MPARYHRHPPPVPRFIKTEPLLQIFKKRRLPSDLEQRLRASLERGAQLFIFVPKIAMVLPAVQLLRSAFPNVYIEGTSSKDDERADKVTQFRERQIRMLVTTTILERGVTIPKSDVFIWDADAPIFDAAALVQMAGRAGRSAQDPNGNVYFSAKEKTSAQAGAVRQIKEMNRIALKKGYLNRVNGEISHDMDSSRSPAAFAAYDRAGGLAGTEKFGVFILRECA
ncbi:hypothetical protein LJK88_00595 [Paenibacillus sp. P26]|nr:hypothetical protein LJK88_00595 [Paenibacillus sp. P26]